MGAGNEKPAEMELARKLRDDALNKVPGSENDSSEEAQPPARIPKLEPKVTDSKESENDSDLDSETSTETALQAVGLRAKRQELELREKIADWIVCAVSAQLLVSAIFFGFYLCHNSQNPDARIMMAWLGSSVIEVVGLAAIVTRNLFPDTSKVMGNSDAVSGGRALIRSPQVG